ncbi:hypothetical protein TspCOW1_30420 [Thiohalobacter sp. COW1]|nr:hypothetical protein TspCOW1_30420 [Thiohalobacter sp. COW1]
MDLAWLRSISSRSMTVTEARLWSAVCAVRVAVTMTWGISSESAAGAAGEMNPEAAVIAAASVVLNIDFSQRTPVRVRMIIVCT